MSTIFPNGYGRIYVNHRLHIEIVEDLIEEIDEYQHSVLPHNLVKMFINYPTVVPTGKFGDFNFDLLEAKCMDLGICIYICYSHKDHNPDSQLVLHARQNISRTRDQLRRQRQRELRQQSVLPTETLPEGADRDVAINALCAFGGQNSVAMIAVGDDPGGVKEKTLELLVAERFLTRWDMVEKDSVPCGVYSIQHKGVNLRRALEGLPPITQSGGL